MIDLHVHTTASDGSLTPREVVKLAKDISLNAIAITDHDTVSGVDEAIKFGLMCGLKVIPGIEFSTYNTDKREIHILGYNINYNSVSFLEKLKVIDDKREKRNATICQRFQNLGFDITTEKLKNRFNDAILTRANFAIYMIEQGYAKSADEAFKKYLNINCPCHVPKEKISIPEACDIITQAEGIPVVAHPTLYGLNDSKLKELFAFAKQSGAKGIEAIYSTNKEGETSKFIKLADEFGLFITGGSDFHGDAKPKIKLGTGLGNLKIPDELLKNIGE